jgi:hypothetical protein
LILNFILGSNTIFGEYNFKWHPIYILFYNNTLFFCCYFQFVSWVYFVFDEMFKKDLFYRYCILTKMFIKAISKFNILTNDFSICGWIGHVRDQPHRYERAPTNILIQRWRSFMIVNLTSFFTVAQIIGGVRFELWIYYLSVTYNVRA